MAELEANLLRAMNIPVEETKSGSAFSSNQKTTGKGSASARHKSNSKTRSNREDSPGKGKGRQPIATRPTQHKTVLSRKYSDNKYDKPDVDARIESQTLKVLEQMGAIGVVEDREHA